MTFRFVSEAQDYSDLAAGRVFYSAPGFTPFPVRLASEIFQRCLSYWQASGQSQGCVLYDPCCGSGYLLAILKYLHWDTLFTVLGSDISPDALQLAERNLAILTPEGIAERIAQIENMLASFGKESHAEALASARKIQQTVTAHQIHPVPSRLFLADVTNSPSLVSGLGAQKVDVIVTDVPYGQRSAWAFSETTRSLSSNPAVAMLEALQDILAPGAIVAIAADKSQKFPHPDYRRVGHFQIGKRRVVFLTLAGSGDANRTS